MGFPNSYWWEGAMTIITVPIYAVAILGEIVVSNIVQAKLYSFKDTLNNLLMTLINSSLDVLMRVVFLICMAFVYGLKAVHLNEDSWYYWVLVIILTDLVYWFVHWLSHTVRFFWAVHTVHHSSENYNITVGFRSSVFEPLYRFVFFLPLGFLGFRAEDVMLAFAIQQLYGSLVHTQLIKRMPFWEIVFVTPSHHRVHHGSNPRYLDKNMGMIFIFWDKLFGTFEDEDDNYQKVRFGLTKNLETHSPSVVIFKEWQQLFADVKNAPGLKNKFMYAFGKPGWSHDGSRLTSAQMRDKEARENGNG